MAGLIDLKSSNYGKRKDGTSKGSGYFGELKRPDGGVSTELSIGVDFGRGEQEIPLLVPTLNSDDIGYLLQGNKPTKEIVDKAISFAKVRMSNGLNPFYQEGEKQATYVKTDSPLRSMADSAVTNREPDYYNKLLGYEGIEVRPYNDHKGIPTIGIGHVIQKGEDFRNYKKEDFQKLFNEKDLPKYLSRTRNVIKDFDKFPASVREEMLASVFRGDLSGSPKTLKLINEGKYDLAATEFLNNDEYRQAKDWEKKKNKRHGVAVRMENISKELNNLNRRKQ